MRALDRDDPRQIGVYRILRILGSGGMGRVYLGRNPGGRTVAVKVIRPDLAHDEGFRTRFAREVAAARRVGGSWTAPVLDADTGSDRPWLVTGYVAGPSLYEAVERHGTLPESSVRALGAGLAEALLAIHGAGLIHRDLKPANVLLSLDGPRVIDFGIARALDASVHTRTGATIGSPGFMSPEQIDGRDVGPATDVFSLGSLLAFAATGETAFGSGNAQALMFRIVAQEPQLDALPSSLRELVAACLVKYAPDRPTPREILDALAPDGAAALVQSGWLPHELATDLTRRTVALLEIDDDEAAETYGSAPFAVPAPPAGSGSDTTPPRRPPPTPAAGQPPSTPAPFAMSGGPMASSSTPGSAAASPSGPQHFPSGGPRNHGSDAVPRRRLVWIPVAAALTAAVALGIFLALDHDPDDPKKNIANSSTATSPGTTGQPPSPDTKPASSSTDKIPNGYVGTWTGTTTSGAGLVSTFTMTISAAPDARGVVASTISRVESISLQCTGDARLISASDTEVIVEDIPGSGPQSSLLGMSLCTSGGQTKVRLQPDGTLRTEVVAAGSGNPKGTLKKQ